MLRILGAIIAGLAVSFLIGFIVTGLVESAYGNFGISRIVVVPLHTLVIETITFFLASFIGCYLANRPSSSSVAVWVVAGLNIVFDVMNASSVVRPGWFVAAALLLPIVSAFLVRHYAALRSRF